MNQKNTFLVVQPKFLIELTWETNQDFRSCKLYIKSSLTQTISEVEKKPIQVLCMVFVQTFL